MSARSCGSICTDQELNVKQILLPYYPSMHSTVISTLNSGTLLRAVRELATRDPDISAVVSRHGPPPLWARPVGFATLVRIVLEQQVSLASGRDAYERLRGVVGRVSPASVERVNEARLRQAGLTRQKASYCKGLAAVVQEGELDLDSIAKTDNESALASLMTIRGIGKWTADIYLLMALCRADVWPDGDLALAKSMQQVKRLRSIPDAAKQRKIARTWAPWQAVGARVLWHAYLCERKKC